MSEEKPLHVRVAEALGCQLRTDGHNWGCYCDEGFLHSGASMSPPYINHYDTDWSATGPLIEKYEIAIGRWAQRDRGYWAAHWQPAWADCGIPYEASNAEAPTPLVAVCNLLLALHAAGKLKPEGESK